jgi:hypothetical protein
VPFTASVKSHGRNYMEQGLLRNIQGRINILKNELIDDLDSNIERMMSEHSAKGLLRSGATIQRVIKEINSLVDSYYSDILAHLKYLPLKTSPTLEENLKQEIAEGLSSILQLANERLSKITSVIKKPELYEIVLPSMEAENSKIQHRFENDLNAYLIDLSKSQEHSTKPWEDEILKLWRFATKGKRKVLTLPIVAIFILVPAVAGLFDSYSKIWSKLSNIMKQEISVPSKSESDVFNEWIIVIGHTKSEKSAKELQGDFKKAYLASGHVNYKNEPIWVNDIFYVRHPKENGIWLVVIDAFSGESSEEEVKKGLDELAQLAFSSRQLTNTLGHFLYGSKVIYYKKSDFIGTYGEIIGQ